MTREEAIEFLGSMKGDLYDLYDDNDLTALDMAINSLKVDEQYQLEYEEIKPISALSENKGEWIPVSERLPEEREWYLAVFKEKDTDFQLIPRVADYIGHDENKWRWIDEEGLPQEYFDLLECIAWMPLPEPYKAESEDKE